MSSRESFIETIAVPGPRLAAASSGPRLVVMSPRGPTYHALEPGTRVTIGRSSDNDIVVASDRSVSRRHVRLHVAQPPLVENLSQRSSTWVGGRKLVEGAVVALRQGEIFECGSVPMMLQWRALDAQPEQPTAAAGSHAVAAQPAGSAMEQLHHLITLVAPSHASVVLHGEVGVGKSWIARRIHELSPRRGKELVIVNCGAISEKLFEAELFGFEKISGDVGPKAGLLELADGGSLLLDEIGEMLPEHQTKLLTVLDTQTVRRVGGTVDRKINVRVLAATNRDLEAEVAARRFREDLLSRLSTFSLTVPPLRERRDEILPLAAHFLQLERARDGATPVSLSPEAQAWLMDFHWPQNVRQLERAMIRAALVCGNGPVLVEHLLLGAPRNATSSTRQAPSTETVSEEEPVAPEGRVRSDTIAALDRYYWNVTAVARHLGVSVRTMYNRIERFGLSRPKGPPA